MPPRARDGVFHLPMVTLAPRAVTVVLWTCLLAALPAFGQQTAEDSELAKDSESAEHGALGWSGQVDLGLSVTAGNSNVETFDLRVRFERRLERSVLRFKADGLKSDTADDRFRQVTDGLTWLPGEMPPILDAPSLLVDPVVEPDVEKYYLEALLERTFQVEPRRKRGSGLFKWHFGTSWERDVDAGLVGRTVVFAGVGHDWWDREDLGFRTRYSLSYTDRNEITLDPEKDPEFAGMRFAWVYHNRWGSRVVYRNELTYNMSLEDTSDYSTNMIQTLDVPMSKRLSLVVSLKWLYNNFPALEDIDVVAEVVVRDPDGVPGSGDEFFETVNGGGTFIEVGTVRERKKSLDTVISTSLRITF